MQVGEDEDGAGRKESSQRERSKQKVKTRKRSKREERQMKETGAGGKKETRQGHIRKQPGSSWTQVSVTQHLQANPS